MNVNFLFHDNLAEKLPVFIRPPIVYLSSAYSGTKGTL